MVYSNEDISRRIRMEQKTASFFKQKLPYSDTRAYRELTISQKEEFQKYINKKGKASHALLVISLLVYASFGILYYNLTGNIVKESITLVPFSLIKHISNFLFIFTTILLILFVINDKLRQAIFERRFKKNYALY